MIPVFIGYDSREVVAFNVLAHSICARASLPVAIIPVKLSQLGDIFNRERHSLQSTDFAFSRFLTPYLSEYNGFSIFMDCDMLMLDDIASLWELRNNQFAVQVVKHNHQPKENRKFLGQPQSAYAKKNWSSVMLFNNERCCHLTPEYVNTASGLELHQFKWIDDDALIGMLPPRWNHLVGYDLPDAEASLVHYTLGGPYFSEYANCEFSDEWHIELESMLQPAKIQY